MTISETPSQNGSSSQPNSILMRWVTELEQRSREANAVLELNGLLQTASSPLEAFDITASSLEKLFPGWSGYIGGIYGDSKEILIKAYWGGAKPQSYGFQSDECHALVSMQPVFDTLPGNNRQCPHFDNILKSSQRVCIPVASQEELFGLISLQLIVPEPGEPYLTSPALTETRQKLLIVIADQLGVTLGEIYASLSRGNPHRGRQLTDLNNRQYLEEMLNRELQNSRLTNTPLSLLFFRLDPDQENKPTNRDPQSGEILKKVGALLASNIRKEDSAALAGSDLFVVTLKNTSAEQAKQVAGRISTLVSDISAEVAGTQTPAPSIGLVLFSGENSEPVSPLKEAESAYQAACAVGPGNIHLTIC